MKDIDEIEDTLEDEYDFSQLKVRSLGPGWEQQGIIRLDEDIAKVFTTAEEVNQALRSLIELAKKAS